ncbi:MAG: hypothetical protein IKX04_08640 [Clostridiales bacterium]|nr:hypothetical protein [Lachnospiraceae bacterium]MBR5058621.1 hypothetical protein [Clostridiales bacterium]
MGYKIGSFNLRNIGLTALGNNNERDLAKIAHIIKKEGFDVVALQEVLSEGKAFSSKEYAKKSILMELGDKWDFKWADAETQLSDTRHEGYGFLWNTCRLRLAHGKTNDGIDRVFNPRICMINKETMQRRPYYARFTPVGTLSGGPRVEFRLICVHTYFGKDTKEHRKIRENELKVLMEDIYPQIADRRYGFYGNGMTSYTILLGDYNVSLYRPWKEKALNEINDNRKKQGKSAYPKPAYLNGGLSDITETTRWGNRRILTVQDQFTSLRSKPDDSGEYDERGYANDYDHFSYEESQFEGMIVKARRIDAVRKYCDDNFEEYYKKVSDHIPIMMTVEFRDDIEEELDL